MLVTDGLHANMLVEALGVESEDAEEPDAQSSQLLFDRRAWRRLDSNLPAPCPYILGYLAVGIH